MRILKLFKKTKRGERLAGKSSKISELRTPYIKKPLFSGKFFKRGKRKKILVMPTRQPKSSGKAKKILTLLILLALTAGLIWLIGFSHFFDVKSWEVVEDGTKITTDENVNKLMQSQKSKNLIFIDENALTTAVKKLHPEVKKIVIKKLFPTKIRVEIEKYPIVANIVNVVQGIQKKFQIDSQGFLAEENIENPELPYIKIFQNEVFQIHTFPIDTTKLNYILNTIYNFKEKFAIKVLNAEYFVRERELHLQTEKNFMVMLDMEKPFMPQLDKLKKALPKLNIYNTPLEYIDLRISGTDTEKVIFKRKK